MTPRLPHQTAAMLASVCLSLAGGVACVRADDAPRSVPEVSLSTLLREIIDRDAPARLPAPPYTLQEASSHDPAATDPANLKTWHDNKDHDQFIRQEINAGRPEWVLMEAAGPGAITRFWTPIWKNAKDATVRFYLDGSSTPAITANFMDLLGGRAFVKPPLAFLATPLTDLPGQLKPGYRGQISVGGDLYFPIPFARGCKVTLDQLPFYYVINYRSYAPGTAVKTFSMDDEQAAGSLIDHVGQVLLEPSEVPAQASLQQAALAPGAELALDLPPGPEAVRELQVQVDPTDAPQALRSVIVQATFDGEPTVWSPLSEFFGTGVRLHPVHDWTRTVDPAGILTARWTMPYEKSGRLSLRNVGDKTVTLKLGASAKPWTWDARSMHFHAKWHAQSGIPTRPYSDWNYVEIQGRGVYVGDTLTVYSPAKPWYGEGDEQIYRDSETSPSQLGTGTEDYYGYAWGMASPFSSPFLSSPRRDAAGTRGNNWLGYTTTSRLRALDAIPFATRLKFDMEIWDWANTQLDYAVSTFWYAVPGSTDNRPPQPGEAQASIKAPPTADELRDRPAPKTQP